MMTFPSKGYQSVKSLFFFFLILMIIIPSVLGAGSAKTIGDTILKTEDLRKITGGDGTGIKVGVISDGVKHIKDAQNSKDMPENVVILSDKRKGDEGTAMLEIIHDIAPNASLFFHDFGGNEEGFNIAIDALVAAGTDVIVDDVGWQSDPFFEDGMVAQHINEHLKKNPYLFFISAAGNAGDMHYQGEFLKGPDGYHLFGDSSGIDIEILPGGFISVILEWDDPWGASTNDYDLALIDISNNQKISISEVNQTGSENPHERLDYRNRGDIPIKAELKVFAKEDAEPKIIELFFYSAKDKTTINSKYLIPEDSIHGQPAVNEVISVTAVSPAELAVIQQFSSIGAITIQHPQQEIRFKPDIVAIDTVDVTGAGGFKTPFSGTSAAAPHVAGLIALVWSLFPDQPADIIKQALFETAQDIGPPGWDNQFGHGLPDAVKMYEKIQADIDADKTQPAPKPKQPIPVSPVTVSIPSDETIITETTTITKPGKYTIGKDIRDSASAIITIASSGVEIDGKGHKIEGVGVRIGMQEPVLQTGILVIPSEVNRLNDVTIKDVTISGCYIGVELSKVDGGVIENGKFFYNANGIVLNSTGSATVKNNEGMGNSYSGILQIENSIGSVITNNRVIAGLHGIVVDQGLNSIISNNSATDNARSGIILTQGSQENTISGNIVSGNKDGGISLYSSLQNTINHNFCRNNNLWGVLLHESSNNVVENNEIIENLRGINLYYADGNTISENTIDKNRASGIFFNPSGNNIIRSNSISLNKNEGIMIGTEVRPNVQNIIYNNVISNTDNLFIQEGAKVNYQWNVDKSEGMNIVQGPYIGGNMWGSPGGAGYSELCNDQNFDGICDGAYEVKPGAIDQFPLKSTTLRPGSDSPASHFTGSDEIKVPSSSDEWVEDGKAKKDRSDFEGALISYQKALGLKANNYQALRDIAIVYSMMKKYPEAIGAINSALIMFPDSTELLNTKGDFFLINEGKYNEAIAAYSAALESDPADIHSLVNKAFALDKIGKKDEAFAHYMEALKINSQLSDAWYKAANVLSSQKRYEEALPLYDKAIGIDSTSAYAYNNKGYTLAQLQQYNDAIESYNQALSIDSDYSAAWKNLGDAYTKLGMIKEAEEAYSHVSKA